MFHYRWHRAWEEWCEDGGYQSCFRPYERQMRIGLQAVTLCLLWRQDNYTFDFSLHQEKGKQGNYGLTRQQLKKAYHTKRNTGNPDYKRFQECKMSKLEVAMDMLRRGWKMGLHAKYVITDSWFTCEQLMTCVRSIGKGAMHFVGLAKMGKTKYTISGKKEKCCRTHCHLWTWTRKELS